MNAKKCIFLLYFFMCILVLMAGCVSDEKEAELQAIGFAERFVGFEIHKHEHDLDVAKSRVDENTYYVEGIVKREAVDVYHDMFVELSHDESDGRWYLEVLVFDDKELYSREK